MKCIHVDRDNSLSENSMLTLMQMPPFEIPIEVLRWVNQNFQGGLSFWGWKCASSIFEIEHGHFDTSNPNFSNCLIEHDFELVRRRNFPKMPSRLQSMFAIANLGDLFIDWTMLFSQTASFYEVFCDTSYSMDAAFLNAYSFGTGYRLCNNTPGIENIYKYWRCEKSTSPRAELLLPLQEGVYIGSNLTIQR